MNINDAGTVESLSVNPACILIQTSVTLYSLKLDHRTFHVKMDQISTYYTDLLWL